MSGIKQSLTKEVSIEAPSISENAVYAQFNTKVSIGEGYSNPHTTTTLSVSLFRHNDDSNTFRLNEGHHIRLAGLWKDSQYHSAGLLDHSFTLAELEVIRDSLTVFIDGIKNGDIVNQ